MTKGKGLELSRKFYEEYGKPLIEQELPDLAPVMATGLVGEGSECFGFDDEISQDHDWGPAFCLWMPQDVLDKNAERIEAVLAKLPDSMDGFKTRMKPEQRLNRVGPLSIERFYKTFLNVPRAPETIGEWRAIPEHYLAVATNGEVFHDPAGIFTGIREQLLAFYPEDIRIKKLAARCVAASQAGQYNLPRMMSRHAYTAVSICRARFTEAVISMLFLLHKKYMPFYKWAPQSMARLSLLGEGIAGTIEQLNCLTPIENSTDDFMAVIEDVCQRIADELLAQGLAYNRDPWLYEQGPSIQTRIKNEALRAMPVQLE